MDLWLIELNRILLHSCGLASFYVGWTVGNKV